jgi:hypothetical protein
MRIIRFGAATAALAVVLVWGASGATPAQKRAAAKKGSQSSRSAVTKKPVAKTTTGTKTAASGSKKAAAPRTTWRNRQLAPAPERYKEIQDALVAKGYLKPEEASGAWTPASTEALKKFQSEQNLDSSGRINSLSLIALGLGPKHDSSAVVKPPASPQVQELPGPGR